MFYRARFYIIIISTKYSILRVNSRKINNPRNINENELKPVIFNSTNIIYFNTNKYNS